MLSKKMNEATAKIQSTLDICCKENNVSMRAAEDLEKVRALVKRLDPSGVDISSNSFMAKQKTKKFIRIMNESYPALKELTDKLCGYQKTVSDTVKTLKQVRASNEGEYQSFLAGGDDTDIEFVQQKTVTQGVFSLLDSTILEYETLENNLMRIDAVLMRTLNSSFLLARTALRPEIKLKFDNEYNELSEALGK